MDAKPFLWVRLLTSRVYEGSFTQKVREQFVPLVAKAARSSSAASE